MRIINHISYCRLFTLLIALFGIFFSLSGYTATPPSDERSRSLTLGVLPIISTHKLIKRFAPMADYFGDKIGVPVTLETAPDYKTFITRTDNEKRYDIIFTAPHFYYLAHQKTNYRVIARIDAKNLVSVIVVPKNSEIITIEDLRHRSISTTDPLALNTVLFREHLLQAGLNPDTDVSLLATPTHNASLISAYKGVSDAASLMIPPYKRAKKEVRRNMRILARTKGVPHMPFAVAPWVSQEMATKLEEILVNMGKTAEGKGIINSMRWPGITKANDSDYDNMGWALKHLKLD